MQHMCIKNNTINHKDSVFRRDYQIPKIKRFHLTLRTIGQKKNVGDLHEEEDGVKFLLGFRGQQGSESINASMEGIFFLLDNTKTWGV